MVRPRIYLDTSTISHLHQLDAPDKMNETLALWDDIKKGKYDVYLSDVGITEILDNKSPKREILVNHLEDISYTLLSVTDEVYAYADKLIELDILTQKSFDDCLHIGCAIVHRCNIILSWNFKHMVRVKTVNGVRSINAMLGYHGIDIYPPNMMIERYDYD